MIRRFVLAAAAATALAGAVGCGGGEGDDSSASQGVILMRYTVGSESTEQREEGFLQTLQSEFPDVNILSSDQYCETTEEMATDKCETMLQRFAGQVSGVFCVCEPNAQGMLTALQNTGMAGKVKFVGFDSSDSMAAALGDGKMHGIVLQDPEQMGYLAVKTMVDHLDGKETPRRVVTGEFVATPDNLDDPEIKRLLHPNQFKPGDFAAPSNPRYTIAVIPKGLSHEFWLSVHYGAARAAAELGDVEVVWHGPERESQRAEQIAIVEDFVAKGVDGICLAPLDARSLVAPVKAAKEAGIPTVIFDSALEESDENPLSVSYVATDNFNGGRLAARRLAEALGFKPKGDDSASADSSETSEAPPAPAA